MSKDVQLIEGWLWKAKRGMTTTWKKHYVRADNDHLYQYTGTAKPTPNDEPKYILDIHKCKIRTSTLRKFAFEIVEHGGKPMTFATDDSVSYKKWNKVLSDKTEAAARIKAIQSTVLGGNNAMAAVSSSSKDQDEHSEISGIEPEIFPDETMTQEEEVLMQHIIDGAKSFGEGRINLDTIRAAIRMADPRLQEERIITLVKKSTVVTVDGKISVNDFRKFWREHAALLMPTQRGAMTAPFAITHPTADSMSSLSSGALCDDIFLNGAEELLEEVITPIMLRLEVPVLATPAPTSTTTTAESAGVIDNNTPFSSPAEKQKTNKFNFSTLNSAQRWYAKQADIDTRIAQLTIHIESFLEQRQQMASEEAIQSARSQWHRQLLDTYEEMHALWEHFYHSAIHAARIIGDEFILPNELKTLKPVESPNHTTIPEEVGTFETYEYDGLHIQLLWQHSGSTAGTQKHSSAAGGIAQLEELLGKIAENEFKETEYLNNTLDHLLWSDRMDVLHLKQLVEDPTRKKQRQQEDDDESSTPHFSQWLKVKRCFTTIVDYSGMRFVAFIPTTDFVQELTLEDGRKKASKSETDEDNEDDENEENVLVAILEEELGAAMNIRYAEDAVYIMEWKQVQCQTTTPATKSTEKASSTTRKYVHGHVDQLLPADLCRPQTHDALVKRLRPEFVKMFRLSQTSSEEEEEEGGDDNGQVGIPSLFSLNKASNDLDSDADNDEESDQDDDLSEEYDANDPKHAEKRMQQKVVDQKAREWTNACGYYYKKHLPFVAHLLDSFQIQPFDSYSLSNTLHTYGVNLRHLGILFTLCKNPTVKQLIFAEIFARSVKRLYREMMSSMSKEERQRAIYTFNVAAREKGQQVASNTVSTALQEPDERGEKLDAFMQQRQALILTIFNRILRRDHLTMIPGKKTAEEMEENNHKFFQLLFSILQQKFGLTLRSVRDLDHCPWHPNQVFLALQYHLQIRFKDDCYTCIEREHFVSTRDFVIIDVIDFFLPKHRRCTIFTEEMSFLLQQKHRFLSLDLMTEATALYAWEHHLAQEALIRYHHPHSQNPELVVAVASNNKSNTAATSAASAASATTTTTNNNTRLLSWQGLQGTAHVTYQLVLCLLLQQQYDAAFRIASQYLSSAFTCLQSVVSGRILAMVVSAAYHSQRHALAMHAFDGSLQLLQRALPDHHPALALPMLALADAYLAHYDQHELHVHPLHQPQAAQSTAHAEEKQLSEIKDNHINHGSTSNDNNENPANLAGLQQAKWLLQMAWMTVNHSHNTSSHQLSQASQPHSAAAGAAGGGAVTTTRFAFALQYRLANLLVYLGEYREAMQHYHALLRTIEQHQQQKYQQLLLAQQQQQQQQPRSKNSSNINSAEVMNVAVVSVYFKEKLHCLYHLCLAHYHCEEQDLALQFGQQTLQSASFGEQHPSLIRSVLMHDHLHAAVQHVVVSTLLVCYDIHTMKNETEIALELLQAAWKLLRGRHPIFNSNGKWYFRNARHIVQVLTQVSLKTLEMTLTALPLQSRITLEALAKEYVSEHGGFDQQSMLMLSSVAVGSVVSNTYKSGKRSKQQLKDGGDYDEQDDDDNDADEEYGKKLVRLHGEVLNPVQVVQYACVAVSELLWLGLGMDYIHWLLQRQVALQQAGETPLTQQPTGNTGRRGNAMRAASTRGTVGSSNAAAGNNPRNNSAANSPRRNNSPLKTAALAQHNQPMDNNNSNNNNVSNSAAAEDAFLSRLPVNINSETAHLVHAMSSLHVAQQDDHSTSHAGSVDTAERYKALQHKQSNQQLKLPVPLPVVSIREVIETLPIAAQAAAVLMLLQQPLDFGRLVVGANMLRQSSSSS